MRSCLSVILILSLAVAAHAAPTATAVRAPAPPVMDGQLTEAIWQTPAPLKDFVVLGKDGPARQPTEAWIAFDDDQLYLAIKAFDSEMGKLKATVTDRDGKVYSDDVLEIFLDPAKTGFSLVQLVFNPLGTQADFAGDAVGMSGAWNGLWQVKTARGADFWSAEVAVPFATLGLSPQVGKEWALNIGRERAADGELSCWSQTGDKFAAPAAFGKVTVDADLKAFYVDLGVQDWGQGIIGRNSLAYTVRNLTSASQPFTATLRASLADQEVASAKAVSPAVAPRGTWTKTLTYDLAKAGAHELNLQIADAHGRLLATTGRMITIAPLAEFMVFKSFYRDDAIVQYQVNVAVRDLPRYHLTAYLMPWGKDEVLARQTVQPLKQATGQIRFDTAKLPLGQYRLRVAAQDKAGQVLLEQTMRFAQLRDDTLKSRLTTIRKSDNMILVNGQPFFPLGLYESPGSEAYMKKLAAAGFNLCMTGGGPAPSLKRLLDTVQQNHMKLWLTVSDTLDFSKDADQKREQLTQLVNTVGAHPALLCWESIDEPAWGSQNADGLYDGYSFLRALDQQRPIWTNHAPRNTIAELAHFNRATDIGGLDIYPVPEPQQQSDLPNKTISVVGDECDKNTRAVAGEKPIFMVLQGFGWAELSKVQGQETKAIMPTLAQSRFMAYESIVHGANGILYWGTHYTQKPSPFWSDLKSLVSELAAMQGVLGSETYQGQDRAAFATAVHGVRLTEKRLDGRTYLILVNEKPEAARVALTVPALKANRLRRLFEGRKVAVRNGCLALRLTGYDVAVLSDDMALKDQRKDFSDEWKSAPAADLQKAMAEPGSQILNGGFEVDSEGNGLPDAWGASVPLTVSTTTDAHSGKSALLIEAVGGELAPLVVQRGANVLADKTYTLSAWVKATPEAEFRIYVEWAIGGHYYGQVLPWTRGTGDWQQVSCTVIGTPDPQGGAYAVAQVKGTGQAIFDDLKLELAP
jgi:hypothetical protein